MRNSVLYSVVIFGICSVWVLLFTSVHQLDQLLCKIILPLSMIYHSHHHHHYHHQHNCDYYPKKHRVFPAKRKVQPPQQSIIVEPPPLDLVGIKLICPASVVLSVLDFCFKPWNTTLPIEKVVWRRQNRVKAEGKVRKQNVKDGS